MAHFAQLDENNTVTQVIVVNNSEIESTRETVEENGLINIVITQSEASGVAFCKALFGENTTWVQTSYNNSFRSKYAGIGDVYDGNSFINLNAPVIEESALSEEESEEEVAVQETIQVQSLSTDQVQTLSTSQISSLEA